MNVLTIVSQLTYTAFRMSKTIFFHRLGGASMAGLRWIIDLVSGAFAYQHFFSASPLGNQQGASMATQHVSYGQTVGDFLLNIFNTIAQAVRSSLAAIGSYVFKYTNGRWPACILAAKLLVGC
jgi:hypothetical protein